MKKSFRLLITIICFVGASSVYAQWTTSGTTNVVLSDPTKNVIVGPIPATPANLHINTNSTGTNSSSTIVSIENSSTTAISKSATLSFINNGNTYSISTSSWPGAGSGMFHITNLIHMDANKVTFSSGYTPEYTGPFATGKYCFRGGLSSFDSIYSKKIGIYMYAPTGYNFGVYGNSYFQNKVVIGTTSSTLPTSAYKLYVGGSAICEELVVKLQANWPDFVFSPQYKLRPLSEVKTFIAENKHLPDVPAACEVEESGVATGEMLTIQMKKIEELTLYLIQMQEENEEMNSYMKKIQAENEALKKRIEALEVK
ncbi:MAG: hypothetical protein ACTHJT_09535 [Cytophaga sp.]|uniref:hypothetical protein n=1 Tax=Cytophaga sp. TaxID=29535 RepID=UPI003F7F9A5B